MADDRHVVLDVWITIEQLVSPAENKDSGNRKAITVRVNPTRSGARPAGSITAISTEQFVIMQISYRCF